MPTIDSDLDAKTERHVVLVAPEIHWNTGNIGRTCLGVNAHLHLIKPIGFDLDEKAVKRAGLDYWHKVKLNTWEDFDAFCGHFQPEDREVALLTKNGTQSIWELPARKRLFLIFGSETKGLPAAILESYPQTTYRIPISNQIRCLNLSTAVGIALYESLRGFQPL